MGSLWKCMRAPSQASNVRSRHLAIASASNQGRRGSKGPVKDGRGSAAVGGSSRPDMEKQATAATRRASLFAKQRLKLLEQEELEHELDDLKPYIKVVTQHLKGSFEEAKPVSRGRGTKKGAQQDLLDCYSRVFTAALDLELREEWQESEERLQSWSRARLEAEGLALFGLTAIQDSVLFKDTILRFFVPNRALPYHNLAQGDIVLISAGRPGDSSYEGVVLDFASRWLRVALPSSVAPLIRGAGWRIDLYANTVAYERSLAAVQRFTRPLSKEDAAAEGQASHAEGLQKLLAGILPPGSSLELLSCRPPSWLRSKEGKDRLAAAKKALAALSHQLNPSQVKAVKQTLGRSLTLWQGPPGTGKTRTLLRFVKAALAGLPKGSQALVTAASNVAVDNLVLGLVELDVKVVRVGQPVKVSSELRSVTLEAMVAQTAKGQAAAKLRQQAAGLPGPQAYVAVQQALELEELAALEVIAASQVVATTCIGAGEPRLRNCLFPLCVLDEATQATEPSSLVPIVNRVEALVLVGDPQQLPPTVKAQAAATLGLDITLFERLQQMGLPPMLLDTQYRMHPAISDFPSQAFYSGRLNSHPKPSDRPLPAGLSWPNTQVPVSFLAVAGPETRTTSSAEVSGYSYYNEAEGKLAADAVQCLLAAGGVLSAADIGVITPYNGQVRHLQQVFHRLWSRDPVMVKQLPLLEIKSVDGFQGREKEVVVFSAVRSNAQGALGFLSDYRRLNVAITRAKRGLVIIGDPNTLCRGPVWAKWLQWAASKRLIVDCSSMQQAGVHAKTLQQQIGTSVSDSDHAS